ncbi:MAG TPA: ABC transporter ATP-binding protein [Patescibacteria group bacterium]|nr:ABC transporter ATP-binding protein [Patescibacteria group bacterium]
MEAGDSAEAPILEGQGLVRTYRLGSDWVFALRGVDVAIARGEFVVVQGPSGSGKTTLINLLGLLDHPDAGDVRLDGRSVSGMNDDALADARRDRIGFVFQSFSLVPVFTAEENVAYPMALRGVPEAESRSRARALLASVGLEDRAAVRPDLLSGGERQRVAIARAIANGPEVVLADEPTANLDSGTAAGILDLMRDLNTGRRVSFVVATHDPRVAERAGRILTLRDGQFVDRA